jgi:Na+-driven multidrug efflux pump
MKDLTQGPIRGHLITMAVPIAIGMLFQTLYLLIDLYFVAQLGNAAIAGVASAGNLSFLVLALTQALGVGTVALIAQAVGRKDQAGATLVFNQATGIGLICAPACSGPMRRRASPAAPTCAGICRPWRCSFCWWPWARRCAAPEL